MIWIALGFLWGSIFCATLAVDLAARGMRAHACDGRNVAPELGGAFLLGALSLLGFGNLIVMVLA